MSISELAQKHNIPESQAQEIINSSLSKLRQWRDKNRPRPHLDDKIIAAWNGLMLTALARAASFLPADATCPDGRNAVQKSLELADGVVRFTKEHLWDAQKRELCRSWREGRGPTGMCEDYAGIISGKYSLRR